MCIFVIFLPELMLLGFISLLLTVFQGLISHICIPPKYASQMLPCKRSPGSSHGSEHELIYYDTIINRRRLLSTDTGSQHCRLEVIVDTFYTLQLNLHELKACNKISIYIPPFFTPSRGRYHCYRWKDCTIFTFSSLYWPLYM